MSDQLKRDGQLEYHCGKLITWIKIIIIIMKDLNERIPQKNYTEHITSLFFLKLTTLLLINFWRYYLLCFNNMNSFVMAFLPSSPISVACLLLETRNSAEGIRTQTSVLWGSCHNHLRCMSIRLISMGNRIQCAVNAISTWKLLGKGRDMEVEKSGNEYRSLLFLSLLYTPIKWNKYIGKQAFL